MIKIYVFVLNVFKALRKAEKHFDSLKSTNFLVFVNLKKLNSYLNDKMKIRKTVRKHSCCPLSKKTKRRRRKLMRRFKKKLLKDIIMKKNN